MPKLTALVAIDLLIEGERVTIEPGGDIPDGALNEHDVRELKKMGSIEDTDEAAAAAKKQDRLDAAASKEFERERQAIKGAMASTAEARKK